MSNINFGNTDAANLTPGTYPIKVSENSYTKYIVPWFVGSFTKIDNVKFHKSAGAYVTGESMQMTGSIGYATPSATDAGAPAMQTSTPSVANVALPHFPPHGPGGSISSPASGSIMQLQLLTTGASPIGAVNQKTLTLTYDES